MSIEYIMKLLLFLIVRYKLDFSLQLKTYQIFFFYHFSGRLGSTSDNGVPDMTAISDIDDIGINHNLKIRYQRDQIYVSFLNKFF